MLVQHLAYKLLAEDDPSATFARLKKTFDKSTHEVTTSQEAVTTPSRRILASLTSRTTPLARATLDSTQGG